LHAAVGQPGSSCHNRDEPEPDASSCGLHYPNKIVAAILCWIDALCPLPLKYHHFRISPHRVILLLANSRAVIHIPLHAFWRHFLSAADDGLETANAEIDAYSHHAEQVGRVEIDVLVAYDPGIRFKIGSRIYMAKRMTEQS